MGKDTTIQFSVSQRLIHFTMCRHLRRSSSAKRKGQHQQSCIQCAFQRPTMTSSAMVEHRFTATTNMDMDMETRTTNQGDTSSSFPYTSYKYENKNIRYRRMSAGNYRMEISSFVTAFSIFDDEFGMENGVYDKIVSVNPYEIWVTVCVDRLKTNSVFQLLNPEGHTFFYKFVRGEYCYGFGHEPAMRHAINRRLYIFQFQNVG